MLRNGQRYVVYKENDFYLLFRLSGFDVLNMEERHINQQIPGILFGRLNDNDREVVSIREYLEQQQEQQQQEEQQEDEDEDEIGSG
jgi:hypothetical protein